MLLQIKFDIRASFKLLQKKILRRVAPCLTELFSYSITENLMAKTFNPLSPKVLVPWAWILHYKHA